MVRKLMVDAISVADGKRIGLRVQTVRSRLSVTVPGLVLVDLGLNPISLMGRHPLRTLWSRLIT